MNNLTKWVLPPYNLDAWNEFTSRIMIVAVEPNGENLTAEYQIWGIGLGKRKNGIISIATEYFTTDAK